MVQGEVVQFYNRIEESHHGRAAVTRLSSHPRGYVYQWTSM